MSPISGFENHQPLRPRARWARIALAAMLAMDLVAVLSGLSEYLLLQRMETEDVSLEEIDASDRRQVTVAIAQTGIFAVAAFCFIRWLHHAYRNLRALGSGNLRYATATAVWSWFVPILNLWRPKQVINDVWRASDPEAPADQSDGNWWGMRPPVLYAVWWTAFVALNFLYNGAFRLSARGESLEELQRASLVTVVADAVSVVAALLALEVVRRTTARQEARAERLRGDIVAPAS